MSIYRIHIEFDGNVIPIHVPASHYLDFTSLAEALKWGHDAYTIAGAEACDYHNTYWWVEWADEKQFLESDAEWHAVTKFYGRGHNSLLDFSKKHAGGVDDLTAAASV